MTRPEPCSAGAALTEPHVLARSTADELLAIARKVADLDLMLLTDLPGIESLPAVRVLVVGFGAAWAGDDVLFGLGTPLAWAAEQAAAGVRCPLPTSHVPPQPWFVRVRLTYLRARRRGLPQPAGGLLSCGTSDLATRTRRLLDHTLHQRASRGAVTLRPMRRQTRCCVNVATSGLSWPVLAGSPVHWRLKALCKDRDVSAWRAPSFCPYAANGQKDAVLKCLEAKRGALVEANAAQRRELVSLYTAQVSLLACLALSHLIARHPSPSQRWCMRGMMCSLSALLAWSSWLCPQVRFVLRPRPCSTAARDMHVTHDNGRHVPRI